MHKGLWFHTIGQRHGLGFGGGPWFAVKKNIKKNMLFVSHGYDPKTAYKQQFKVHDMHWLTLPLPKEEKTPITFKIRHTSDYLNATISPLSEGEYLIEAEKPIHGVAPGQFCVIYDDHHHRCFGSAEITV